MYTVANILGAHVSISWSLRICGFQNDPPFVSLQTRTCYSG